MKKIALIDDNMVFRKVTKMLLKKIGCNEQNILLFENGSEIYDYMNDNIKKKGLLPQVLFLDLNMPVMDGWEFLKLFVPFKKHHDYNPKIFILTSSVDHKDYKSVMNITTVEDYLIKPIDKATLSDAIQH